ncbi:MAG: hypothetical protein KJ583_02850 [Nanoarchaeota archaeon]|nr:hypothetical protein [Nanoarchaeota archaeon]MBU1270405.1 hypothetical protein [Nanoarchaeota archaeon]MBU1604233.1 hypothetical protein [Nanoarchaeota archaeon]MBU2442439.1 hypothetical protein [Nanoarchaeota archaeon]
MSIKKHSKTFLAIIIVIVLLTALELQEVDLEEKCSDIGYQTEITGKAIVWTCSDILTGENAPQEGYPDNWVNKCCEAQNCRLHAKCF